MEVTFTSLQSWSTGGSGVLKIKNSTAATITNWQVTFIPTNFSITGMWNFLLTGGHWHETSTIKPQLWSGTDLLPGQELSSDFNYSGANNLLQFAIVSPSNTNTSPTNTNTSPTNTTSSKKMVVAYYPEYGVYSREYFPANVPVNELDVIVYAFVTPNPNQQDYNTLAEKWPFPIPAANYKAPPTIPEGTIIHHDQYAAKEMPLQTIDSLGNIIMKNGAVEGLKALKAKKPSLKIIPSVGGWSLSWTFSKIFKDPQLRQNFVKSAVLFVSQNGFDGLDIDWEFPGKQGIGYNYFDPINDQNSLTAVFKELREAFNAAGMQNIWLTAAAGADPAVLKQYNGAAPYMDFLFVMTYDFMGAWGDGGHHSPLYKSTLVTAANVIPDQFWANAAINNAKAAGFTPSKILIGSPIYGRGWANLAERATPTAIFSKSLGGAAATLDPPSYGEAGNSAWINIKKEIDNGYMKEYYDSTAEAAWGEHSNGTTWTFENVKSLTAKLNYMENNNLAGVFFWDASCDFKDANDPNSLIGTASRFVKNAANTNPTTNPTTPTTDPTTNPTTNPTTPQEKPVLELKNVGTSDFVLKPGDSYKIYQN